MALTGTRTYVGFGFGAIQAGLFLYEAYRSGNFARLVVAEVLPDLVAKDMARLLEEPLADGRPPRPSNVAVLVRTNRQAIDPSK